ncbi:TPA: hypothetical protein N0F65_005333 [Lagenidium giganteum]|uniref:HTH CENPB-type domain-containing protein n=1 Tax=Lagenidium giganteum TaxID=4803 RepID=A0AAV2YX45_9STRA|nr:TPA: hypothetical protein N0F65_005333 [Lagenidium giganteum]
MRRESLRKSIYRWEKQRQLIEKIASHHSSARQSRQRSMGHGRVLCEAAEKQLVEWVNNLRVEGVPVSSTMLRVQALEVSRQTDVPEGKFAASHVWQRRFLRAHSLVFGAERIKVCTSMEANDVSRLINVDQPAVFFMLPKRNISNRGTKTVWVKRGSREKQCATAMVLANVSGIKFPLFMVFHTKPSTNPDT